MNGCINYHSDMDRIGKIRRVLFHHMNFKQVAEAIEFY